MFLLCYVTLRYVVTLRYLTLCYVTLPYVMLLYVTLRCVTLRYVMFLCYVTLRYVVLRYVMKVKGGSSRDVKLSRSTSLPQSVLLTNSFLVGRLIAAVQGMVTRPTRSSRPCFSRSRSCYQDHPSVERCKKEQQLSPWEL